MHASLIISALAATAFAAPSAPATFHLQTVTDDKRFNGLCVYGYHTGAGTTDAGLAECAENPNLFYTNGTMIQSTLFGAKTPAAVYAPNGVSYNDWYPVAVNTGYGTSGFTYNAKTGYKQENGAGFIACNWSHQNRPQLFSIAYKGAAKAPLPSNCAFVTLVRL